MDSSGIGAANGALRRRYRLRRRLAAVAAVSSRGDAPPAPHDVAGISGAGDIGSLGEKALDKAGQS